MLVRATEMSLKLQVAIKELKRIAAPGEEFEVSSIRYKILSGNNKYNAVFVIKVPEQSKEEEVPKKQGRSRSKKNITVVEEPLVQEDGTESENS